MTNLNVEVGPKRLELLRELLPSATLIAVLVNPTNPTIDEPFVRELQAAARTIGLKLHVLHASTERSLPAPQPWKHRTGNRIVGVQIGRAHV